MANPQFTGIEVGALFFFCSSRTLGPAEFRRWCLEVAHSEAAPPVGRVQGHEAVPEAGEGDVDGVGGRRRSSRACVWQIPVANLRKIGKSQVQASSALLGPDAACCGGALAVSADLVRRRRAGRSDRGCGGSSTCGSSGSQRPPGPTCRSLSRSRTLLRFCSSCSPSGPPAPASRCSPAPRLPNRDNVPTAKDDALARGLEDT